LDFLGGVYPTSVHITEHVPAVRAVHIGIKSDLLPLIIGLDGDARKYVVPGSAVMFLHGIKVPSERLRYFFFQILPGPFDVDIGNGGAHLYDGIAAGIKFGKISHTIRELSNYFAIVNNLFINPSAEINHILVKLDNEKDGIILV